MENKKILIVAIIAIVVVVGGIVAYFTLSDENGSNTRFGKTEYTMSFYSSSSEMGNPSSKADSYMNNKFMQKDMNNETMDWLKGFDSKYVYISGDSSDFIMSREDYNKLKSNINTSEIGREGSNMTYFKVIFKADTGDIKPLGGIYKDVIQVSNVEFVSKTKVTS